MLFLSIEPLEHRLRTARQRPDPLVVVGAAIEIIDITPSKQICRPPAGLFRSAVVEAQLAGASTDVDTAAPHYHPVAAVDSLVAVAGDEKVITSRGSDGPNQRKGLSAHVLGFIHDDGGIAAAGTVFSEQCGGIPVGIVHFLQAALSELCAVLLEYRPHPDTGAGRDARRRDTAP